jgi:hypothetical protein
MNSSTTNEEPGFSSDASLPWLDEEQYNYDPARQDQDHRELAGAYGAELDYTVLSVGVMTLALLLGVELVKHHMNHSAHGRPFFASVLEMVYGECTFRGNKHTHAPSGGV